MPFNVLANPAFPVVTRSGATRRLVFADLADTEGDFPVDFDWPRADFNIASYELAIGVTTLALQPSRPSDWNKLWADPPTPAVMRERLAPLVFAFSLDGDGPRFLQELGGVDAEGNPVEALLIDTPGVNGQKKNADLLTHRNRFEALGLPATAMALHALQQFAPSGGAGNRTSMRGGGPLTTLVIPAAPHDERPPLWRTILANLCVEEHNDFDPADLPKILPWLAPTLVSDKAHGGRVVHHSDPDAHPLQAFFGMPRRIALQFGEGVCGMTGEAGVVAAGFAQKPWGVNYGQWKHPLTPYRQLKPGAESFTVKPKSARFGYRDWVAATVSAPDGLREPAGVIAQARGRRHALRAGGADARFTAAGWAMNNMEAVAFLSAEQPLHLAATDSEQAALDALALRLADGADEVAGLLRMALRRALFGDGAKPDTDSGLFDDARLAFYETTEDAFHVLLQRRLEMPAPDDAALREDWRKAIASAAEKAFERAAPIPLDDAQKAGRIVDGFRMMKLALMGHGKLGRKVFDALTLPLPSKPGVVNHA